MFKIGEIPKVRKISKLEINQKEGYVIVSVNPKIYPLEVVYSAAYVFLDRAFLVLDGDPDKEILVELRSKEKQADLEMLGRDFNNELLNYSLYILNSKNSSVIRDALVQRAMETNSKSEQDNDEDESSDDDFLDDPLGIAKPWEETHKDESDKC